MVRPDTINKILISLKIDGESSLFIFLKNDGKINRLGNGTFSNKNLVMFTGQLENNNYFLELMKLVNNEILEYAGVYDDKEKKGKQCKLSVIFSDHNDEEIGFIFTYGFDSYAIPKEIHNIVTTSIDLTNSWWLDQINLTNKKEKWWKFWK